MNFEGELEDILKTVENLRLIQPEFEKFVEKTVEVFKKGRKVLLCGNGGSHAQAQHLAVEYMVRFKKDRRPWPAIALASDPAYLTAHTNDMGFEGVFARQVEAIGEPGDLLLGLSTSGKSRNVLLAIKKAKEKGLYTVFLTGPNPAESGADIVIKVQAKTTARIQEMHIILGHMWVDEVERRLGVYT